MDENKPTLETRGSDSMVVTEKEIERERRLDDLGTQACSRCKYPKDFLIKGICMTCIKELKLNKQYSEVL